LIFPVGEVKIGLCKDEVKLYRYVRNVYEVIKVTCLQSVCNETGARKRKKASGV